MPQGNFFPQFWADKTLESMIRALQEKQRVINSITDYTPRTIGMRAEAYHGPRVGSLKAVNLPASASDIGEPSKSAIRINFDQKKGVIFRVQDIEQSMTNINLVNEITTTAKDAILDEYDELVVNIMLKEAGHRGKLATAGKIVLADFIKAYKILNAKKAPRVGRFALLSVEHEAQLYNIEQFVSRDKIKDANAIKEGVIGRLMGFDILLYQNMPKINANGDVDENEAQNNKDVSIFYQSLCVGFARQKEFGAVENTNILIPAHEFNIYSVYGGTVQEKDFVVTMRDN